MTVGAEHIPETDAFRFVLPVVSEAFKDRAERLYACPQKCFPAVIFAVSLFSSVQYLCI